MGLVAHVFDEQQLQALPGEVAIGHTRYSTTGANKWSNAQPLIHHGSARTIALGHNGNLVNVEELRAELVADGIRPASGSDTELIAALIARDPAPLVEAVANTMRRLEGAYSVTALVDDTLVAFRDPRGFRPLSLGRIGDDWVVASETCALDLIGAEVVRDVQPGEVVWVDGEGLHAARPCHRPERALHLRARLLRSPRTRASGASRCTAPRVRMGERLAEEAPADADLVIGVADGGTPAAIGFSRASGIPYNEALIKNRYVARTFIQPDQGMREQGIRMKFNPLAEVEGGGSSSSTTRSSAGTRRASSSRCSSTRARPRCTSASPRRRSSPRASTGSTWPTRTSSPPPTARSRRCASTSARPRSTTSRSRACSRRPSFRRTRSAAPASRASTRRASRPGPRSFASSPRPPDEDAVTDRVAPVRGPAASQSAK